jgi:carboxyl-terminal processing protease
VGTLKILNGNWASSVRVRVPVLLTAMLACAGCADHDPSTPIRDPDPPTLEGTWISSGWNLALVAKGGVIQTYELSTFSCLPYLPLSYEGMNIPELGGVAHVEGGQLLIDLFGTAQIRATRAESLPTSCDNGGTPLSKDPELAFEVFASTFEDMYASFDLRGIDWHATYDSNRPRVTSTTPPDEVFELLCEMVKPLDDPHVLIGMGESVCESRTPLAWTGEEKLSAVLATLEAHTHDADTTMTGNDRVAYRTLADRYGYVFLPGMEGFADTPDADVKAAGRAMDEVVAALQDLDGLIIDVRFNGGGSDAISLALASRFADQRRLVFSVETREGDGWTPRRDYYLEPDGPAQFTGPVVLLTSRLTVSAAETFTLAMRALPHVKVVGETTSGGLSTMMLRNLPNGFGFGLPFERVFAPNDAVYEGVGLAPDVEAIFDPDAFVGGSDTMLEAAIGALPRER